jgi:hypothetical protein
LRTVQVAIAENTKPKDLSRPGHVFPLRAVAGGVLERNGHTEGSVRNPFRRSEMPYILRGEVRPSPDWYSSTPRFLRLMDEAWTADEPAQAGLIRCIH